MRGAQATSSVAPLLRGKGDRREDHHVEDVEETERAKEIGRPNMKMTRRSQPERKGWSRDEGARTAGGVSRWPEPHRRRTGQADLHLHTTASDGVGTVEEVLAFAQQRTDLDVIAVTDHDTIEGALRARDLVATGSYRFEVIVGEEISTREGHLLALFLERRIAPGLSIERSIDLVHEQGGLAIVAHPFNRLFRHSVQRPVMDRLWRQPAVHLDGMETLNGSFAGIGSSQVAMTLSRRYYRWAETGGSDAHTATAIGCARTRFAGQTATDLRAAILARLSRPAGGYWLPREYVALARYYAWPRRQVTAAAVPAMAGDDGMALAAGGGE